ncbi:MAG: NTP transferase domain-containing protein [Planctomycetes bacterium]|nr:NTP transferase domain-containing protein [Planctomycetota bacterium]
MSPTTQPSSPSSAIILAAGKGTRMNSDLPKVMHPVAGQPMVKWVVRSAREAGAKEIVLVVGHRAEVVEAAFSHDNPPCHFVTQSPQLGTGHAVDQARSVFEKGLLGEHVLVLCGDGPLIRGETLEKLWQRHRSEGAAASLATSILKDATGYGRIERDAAGKFRRIVEEKDATAEQKKILEVNPSYYLFNTKELFAALKSVTNANASGEYYITDVFELLLKRGLHIAVMNAVPVEEVLSINTPAQLAEVDGILRGRKRTPLESTP